MPRLSCTGGPSKLGRRARAWRGRNGGGGRLQFGHRRPEHLGPPGGCAHLKPTAGSADDVEEVWGAGDAYEPYIGRWSRVVAVEFLDWLAMPPHRSWVDVGCGTGALSAQILARCDPTAVSGVDPSGPYVAWAAAHLDDARLTLRVADATELSAGDNDVVVSGLVLNFLPDARAALAAVRRAAPRGHHRGLRLGLRRTDGSLAALLGCGGGPRPRLRRGGRESKVRYLQAGSLDGTVVWCRPRRHRLPSNRRARRVRRLRRVLEAISRRPGARRRLCHVPRRRAPRRVYGKNCAAGFPSGKTGRSI